MSACIADRRAETPLSPMRSSVACLPKGILTSLSLSPDHQLLKAGVLYGQSVALCGGEVAHWVFWSIRRLVTREGEFIWAASPFFRPSANSAAMALQILDGANELTAHQFKGLAAALGIWGSVRKAPMLERVDMFNRQAISATLDCCLGEMMARDTHFGLSPRAAATGRCVGP